MIEVSKQSLGNYLKEVRERSMSQLGRTKLNALIYGQKGIGKSTLLTTCPTPVLVHSFDPGGCSHLTEERESGRLIYDDRFENEDARNPRAWNLWETEFDKMRKDGVFEQIGTYAIDSLTLMQRALYNEVASGKSKRGTNLAEDGVLIRKGWGILTNILSDMIKLCAAQKCHFLLLCHVDRALEEVSGRMFLNISTNPASKVLLPMMFGEMYYMTFDPTDASKRVLQTIGDNRVIASSRFSRTGKFNQFEPANIKELMKKAMLPCEDKQTI